MYKDIISYKLAEGITKEHLLAVSSEVVQHWMRKQPGFVKWEIHRNKNGDYTDIVYWESKEAAQNAEKEMGNIPNAKDWFACYEPGSINSINLTQIGELK